MAERLNNKDFKSEGCGFESEYPHYQNTNLWIHAENIRSSDSQKKNTEGKITFREKNAKVF